MKSIFQSVLFALVVGMLITAYAGVNIEVPANAGRGIADLRGSGWKLWRDANASWENDELFLPPVDLKKIPVNPPTGGWDKIDSSEAKDAAVPGTAEEFLGNGTGSDTLVKGVTWWTRTLRIPVSAAGKKIRLQFDSVRLRAEVYVNQKLVAYDVVGNTPFEADITGAVSPGSEAQLAVRVTNPGGNSDWADVDSFKWGDHPIPASHGFGGVTGGVRLVISDPVYVDDVYVQNTPAITAVNVIATVKNTTGREVRRDVEFVVSEKMPANFDDSRSVANVFQKELKSVKLVPGDNVVTCAVSVPDAKRWDLQHPNLYECGVQLADEVGATDSLAQTFGFRWFAPEGIGSNAVLRLNGNRIVLRTAISWGFWPINGIFPTPELAEKQICAAKELGMNMLNFHRCIGNPIVFDQADKQGLLYFEEPGGYVSGETNSFAQALCREKLLRMVMRDRSHPSLVIFNLINEQWDKFGANTNEALFAIHRADLQVAHALDPSRTMLYTSAWAGRSADPDNDKAKMQMRPFDDTVHMNGWWDYHRAGGPEVWRQEFYKSPTDHYGNTTNRNEIVYWGEEGATSTPPRLGRIKAALDQAPHLGWDGQVYLDWYQAFDEFLTAKKLRGTFATVDDLCQAMGAVSLEHQGRKIEDTRICDLNDGYAINGWEAEISNNHSGVVDEFRNPKADPAILAYYNQPLYVAVKPRQQIVSSQGSVLVDFYVLNEKNLQGPHLLQVRAVTAAGREIFTANFPVQVRGGEVFSQLVAEEVAIPAGQSAGLTTITARLLDADGVEKAAGHDQFLSVNWKDSVIGGHGAVYENGSTVRDFLRAQKGINALAFDDTQAKLDWLVVVKSAVSEPVPVAADYLLGPDGQSDGVRTTFFSGSDFANVLYQRMDHSLELSCATGAIPDPHVPLTENYTVRWEGKLLPPADGEYTFVVSYDDGARLWLGERKVVEDWKYGKLRSRQFKVHLTGGRPVPLKLELLQKTGEAEMHLLWKTPLPEKLAPAQVLERARRDGTTVVILDRAESWLEPLGAATGVKQGGSFALGLNWLGGQYFVKAHPLFKDLPADQALNWPYQAVVGGKRTGLEINGGEFIAGAYQTWPMRLGTAVAVVPCGQGSIIISTLDIARQLANPDSAAEVARKLFCNYLEYASALKK